MAGTQTNPDVAAFTVKDTDELVELCSYDGSQESEDRCVNAMCCDLGILPGLDGQFSDKMIMVVLWAWIKGLEQKTQGISYKESNHERNIRNT